MVTRKLEYAELNRFLFLSRNIQSIYLFNVVEKMLSGSRREQEQEMGGNTHHQPAQTINRIQIVIFLFPLPPLIFSPKKSENIVKQMMLKKKGCSFSTRLGVFGWEQLCRDMSSRLSIERLINRMKIPSIFGLILNSDSMTLNQSLGFWVYFRELLS